MPENLAPRRRRPLELDPWVERFGTDLQSVRPGDWDRGRYCFCLCCSCCTPAVGLGRLTYVCAVPSAGALSLAACNVFRSSIAMVIGPTPPGTGVIARPTGQPLEIDVAAEPTVVPLVNANVDHGRAGLDPIGGHLLGLPHGDDQKIGLPRDRRGVAGGRMTDGHRRVAGRSLLKQEQRYWSTHKPRTAQDDRVRASSLDTRISQQLANTQRRARHEPGRAGGQKAEVHGMNTIDVLERRDPLDHDRLVDRFRQRELDKNAMHQGVGIEGVDSRQQLSLRRRGRQPKDGPVNPDLL